MISYSSMGLFILLLAKGNYFALLTSTYYNHYKFTASTSDVKNICVENNENVFTYGVTDVNWSHFS